MTLHTPERAHYGSEQFGSFFMESSVAHYSYKQTFHHAMDIGIRARDILAYAKGELPPHERAAFEDLLNQSPWAMSRVVAIVKTWRNGQPKLWLEDDYEKGMMALEQI